MFVFYMVCFPPPPNLVLVIKQILLDFSHFFLHVETGGSPSALILGVLGKTDTLRVNVWTQFHREMYVSFV